MQEDINERSLDDFLADAASRPSDHIHWRYWFIFLSLGVANSSDASEILCLSYTLSEQNFEKSILQNEAWRAGLLAAAVFLGMLIGGLLVGALGDWKGRRPMLLVGLMTNCISGILSACAFDVISLSLLRLVAGVGIGATVPPLFTLCSELSPPADRGFWVTVAASFWMVGSIYVAVTGWYLLGYLQTSWRLFMVACALPSALGCFLVYSLVPESPRFLALQGQHDKATKVAQHLADCMNYVGPQLRPDEVREHYPYQTAEAGINQELGSTSILQTAFSGFAVSASQLYTPGLRKTTFPLQIVWFSLSFGSYGLLTWINTLFYKVHLENVYFNALLFALSNLPGNLLSAWLMDRTGRASLLTGSVIAASLSLLGFAYVAAVDSDTNQESLSPTWIVLSACAFQCFTIAAWNSIDVLTSELFPTTVRSTGMGVCAASGRIGAMLAQFVNGVLVARPVRLLLVAAATLLLGALTPSLLPSGDRTGEAMSDIVEGTADEDAAVRYGNRNSPYNKLVQADSSRTDYPYQPQQEVV